VQVLANATIDVLCTRNNFRVVLVNTYRNAAIATIPLLRFPGHNNVWCNTLWLDL
jgi:hypothetical protein